MQKLVARSVALLLFGVLTLGPFAQAQHSERSIKANIPFDFTVGSRAFPAGRYLLVRIDPSVLELRDSEGRLLANLLTQSVQSMNVPVQPKLLFDSEGGGHVLTQVWQEDETIGQQILASRLVTHAVQKPSRHVQTAQVGNPR